MPTISCIIPTYKREDMLVCAVESVLKQEFDGELEVIVVNDAGIPLKYTQWMDDARVTIINTNHAERCFARNTGAAIAKGKWLHFLDDDDIILPGAYTALQNAADANESACWIQSAHEFIDNDGTLLDIRRLDSSGNVFALALLGGVSLLQSALILRSAFMDIGGFNPEYIVCQDDAVFLEVALRYNVAICEHISARVRLHCVGRTEGSLSKCELRDTITKRIRDNIFISPKCLPAIFNSLAEHNFPTTRGKLVRFYIGSALRHFKLRAFLTGVSRLLIGIRLSFNGLFYSKFWLNIAKGK